MCSMPTMPCPTPLTGSDMVKITMRSEEVPDTADDKCQSDISLCVVLFDVPLLTCRYTRCYAFFDTKDTYSFNI